METKFGVDGDVSSLCVMGLLMLGSLSAVADFKYINDVIHHMIYD